MEKKRIIAWAPVAEATMRFRIGQSGELSVYHRTLIVSNIVILIVVHTLLNGDTSVVLFEI